MSQAFNLKKFEYGEFKPHHTVISTARWRVLTNPSCPRMGWSIVPRSITVMYNTKEEYVIFPEKQERIPYDQLAFEQLLIDRHYKFTKSEPSNDYVTYNVSLK